MVTELRSVSGRGIEAPPELVVEVLSPSTGTRDRGAKARRYAALGVGHLWLLEPDTCRLECHRLEGQAYQLVIAAEGDATFEHPDWPGLTIRLAELRA